MRKLMWFAVGFTAACAAGVYLLSGFWSGPCAGLCFVPGVVLCFLKSKNAKRTAAALLGGAAAFLWVFCFHAFYLNTARSMDGEVAELTFEAADYSYETGYGVAADGYTKLGGKRYQIKAYIPEGQSLAPGDQVTGTFRLRYTASGASQEPTYHQSKGIFLLAYSREVTSLEKAPKVPPRYFAAKLRRIILDQLDGVFPEDTLGFARALLLGDTTHIDYETDRNFQTSGISHVIAVSGMHVSILFSLVYLLCGKKRFLTALIGIPVLILFAAVAGFTPSIVRACVMQCLMILALLINREYDPPTALAFAVLVILGANPMSITSAGFQLSVACMIGIFAFSARLTEFLLQEKLLGTAKGKSLKARLTRTLASSVSITLSTMVVTAPLCALHFGMVSIVGILTNLLTMWVVSFVFYGIMAACLLGSFWLPLGQGIAWVISWPVRYVLWISGVLGEFPLASVYTQSPYITIWLVFSYVLLAVFFLCGAKRPGLPALGITVGLVIAVAISWIEPRMDHCRVTVLDVGQGQCILLQSDGENYLVDCGSERENSAADAALEELCTQGIFHLDGLILTHYDKDHAGDVLQLLSCMPVDRLYLPDTYDENLRREAIEEAYASRIYWVQQDTAISLKLGSITLFTAENAANDNESSLCVLFQPANYDILITGDRSARGERELIAKTRLPKLELLVAGHHGARDATSRELLVATRPVAVAISADPYNHYDHPSEQTLDRLAQFGCKVLRTDLQGTILFRG